VRISEVGRVAIGSLSTESIIGHLGARGRGSVPAVRLAHGITQKA